MISEELNVDLFFGNCFFDINYGSWLFFSVAFFQTEIINLKLFSHYTILEKNEARFILFNQMHMLRCILCKNSFTEETYCCIKSKECYLSKRSFCVFHK